MRNSLTLSKMKEDFKSLKWFIFGLYVYFILRL